MHACPDCGAPCLCELDFDDIDDEGNQGPCCVHECPNEMGGSGQQRLERTRVATGGVPHVEEGLLHPDSLGKMAHHHGAETSMKVHRMGTLNA